MKRERKFIDALNIFDERAIDGAQHNYIPFLFSLTNHFIIVAVTHRKKSHRISERDNLYFPSTSMLMKERKEE